MTQNSIVFDGYPVYYKAGGRGKNVLLLHGFGEDSFIWDQQVKRLKSRYHLMVPDIPGSGDSPEGKGSYSMEYFADMLKLILEKESVGDCCLIGHSMGGYIALAFAEKYPSMLSAFGLFHSTSYADTEARKEARRKNMAFIREHGAKKFIEQSTPGLFSMAYQDRHPESVNQIVRRYTNFSPDPLVKYYEAMISRPDRREVLKSFDKPILFVIGKHDNAVPLKDSLEQCHQPDLSYVLILNESGHMGMIEEADRSNAFLEKFLNEYEIANP